MSRVILLIGLGLGNKKAPGRGAFLLCMRFCERTIKGTVRFCFNHSFFCAQEFEVPAGQNY